MLDADTKRRIDTARDILVGKVPDPKSQVEQITIALIYKFMDDIDAQSEEWGGKRKFFAGDFARYGWARLLHHGLGGHEILNLYSEAIDRMPQNPGIPPLFRDIFENAYLPYRDPQTLRTFLEIIDEFSYDHSERLGDAFEYLLSVLGSQGDAGQFRTPRHIIDFIVAVIDPKKDETLLDPACGTAGFLISSYKHVLANNADDHGNSTLTPDEKARLAANVKGYDISPDMVRLSLVNMYLHDFVDPHIFEYDTLTSEERWHEYADVILANPPFMSPKGGIRPHNRFSVKSKRSEVLFVDYMAEHLTPSGRAGIIVPEGIIFQSQSAYKQLRKTLVEEYLVAVVSLPAGVFQPYSGVKTSILILDRSLAKKTNHVGFFKVENDGFDLGAQRRPVEQNDLPQARQDITAYLRLLGMGESLDDFQPALGLIVEKAKIAANGDYNLSGERYRESGTHSHMFPLVSIGDSNLFRVESGGTPKSNVQEYWNGGVPWVTLVDLPPADFITEVKTTERTISELGLTKCSARLIPDNSILVSTRATIGRIGINRIPLATNQGFKNIVIEDLNRVVPEYVALALKKLVPTMEAWASGGTFKEISKSKFCELQVPLPPLQVQQEIVAEIDGYQKVIDGARTVVDHYRPHISIDPDWPMVALGETANLVGGYAFKSDNMVTRPLDSTYQPVLKIRNVGKDGRLDMTDVKFHIYYDDLSKFELKSEDIVLAMTGATVGKVALVDQPRLLLNQRVGAIRAKEKVCQRYLFYMLWNTAFYNFCQRMAGGGAQSNIGPQAILVYAIPLPPLETQQTIVAEIEAEQATVANCRDLIDRFEGKIRKTIARVWGEENNVPVEA